MVVFSVIDMFSLEACDEWLRFIPTHALEMIRAVRLKLLHPCGFSPSGWRYPPKAACTIDFDLHLDDPGPRRLTYWGNGHQKCQICVLPQYGNIPLDAKIKSIMAVMCHRSKLTARCLGEMFRLLGPMLGTS